METMANSADDQKQTILALVASYADGGLYVESAEDAPAATAGTPTSLLVSLANTSKSG